MLQPRAGYGGTDPRTVTGPRAECRDVGHIGGSRLVVVPCPAVPAGAWRSRSRSRSSWAGRVRRRGSSDCEIGTRRYRASKYAHEYPHTTQHEFRPAVLARAPASAHCGSRPRRSPLRPGTHLRYASSCTSAGRRAVEACSTARSRSRRGGRGNGLGSRRDPCSRSRREKW